MEDSSAPSSFEETDDASLEEEAWHFDPVRNSAEQQSRPFRILDSLLQLASFAPPALVVTINV